MPAATKLLILARPLPSPCPALAQPSTGTPNGIRGPHKDALLIGSN